MSYRLHQKILKETYEDYLVRASKRNQNKDQWIKDIVSGKTHTDGILFQNKDFIMFPPAKWNMKDMKTFHMLTFVKDFSIRSMRDLNGSHISLLEDILRIGSEEIEKEYKIKQENLKIYVHYPPTSWILHIHFNVIDDTSSSSSVEYSNSLYNIILNLKMNGDYFKQDLFVMM
jgi:m7GpppX diphosphatase